MSGLTSSVCERLLRTAAWLWRARDANVALIFALALIPLLAVVGAAVDLSRANRMKASMQAALDSTALMLSKTAATADPNTLQTSAQSYFQAIFRRSDAKNVQVTATYSSSGGSNLVINAQADIDTEFMRLFGLPTITVTSSASTRWGTNRLRVALALDTTGSMAADGKIAALKTATKNLLTQLRNAASVDGDVYVSIIPFSKDVNPGAGYFSASWLNWDDWEGEPQILDPARGGAKPPNWAQIGPGSNCPFSTFSYGFRCTSGPTNGRPNVSTIPTSGSYAGYICPSRDGGNALSFKNGIYYNGCYNSVPTTSTSTVIVCTGDRCECGPRPDCTCTGRGRDRVCRQTITTTGAPYQHNWIANARSTWNGCITDRGNYAGPVNDYDRLATAPDTGIPASLFPAEQYSYCSPVMMGLSYNWSAMSSFVDSLTPSGATNQPIGLVWGWQSLVGGGPLSAPAEEGGYNYTNVIILLSDGLNTQDRWYGTGYTTSTAVDARMLDSSGRGTCANIKAAGIMIYTIQVNTGGDPTSTLLRRCASSTDKFYLLTSASQIITAFDTIGNDLTRLRLSQ